MCTINRNKTYLANSGDEARPWQCHVQAYSMHNAKATRLTSVHAYLKSSKQWESFAKILLFVMFTQRFAKTLGKEIDKSRKLNLAHNSSKLFTLKSYDYKFLPLSV